MILAAIYLAGFVIALAVMRDPWPARMATAVVWPLGPLAFVVVVSILLVAAVVLWPLPILGVGALLGILAWLTL
ncbi:MAG TPA: hypothetical protein VMO26_15230 [Vicinamibacterales bacterium]|nr:hypothetical protein [Vicinamibacterales bacterium]